MWKWWYREAIHLSELLIVYCHLVNGQSAERSANASRNEFTSAIWADTTSQIAMYVPMDHLNDEACGTLLTRYSPIADPLSAIWTALRVPLLKKCLHLILRDVDREPVTAVRTFVLD